MIEGNENAEQAEQAEIGKRTYTKREKKADSSERFPVIKNCLTVFRTEEEFAEMEKDGWVRV